MRINPSINWYVYSKDKKRNTVPNVVRTGDSGRGETSVGATSNGMSGVGDALTPQAVTSTEGLQVAI